MSSSDVIETHHPEERLTVKTLIFITRDYLILFICKSCMAPFGSLFKICRLRYKNIPTLIY